MVVESTDYNEQEKIAVHKWLIGKMLESVPFAKNQKVLDLEVGTGNYTLSIADQVQQIDALHSEEKSLSVLQEALKRKGIQNVTVHPAVESYDKLPFEPGTFDIVSCRTAIHHVSFSNLSLALREIHRVLKADGMLSIMDAIVSDELKAVWTPLARIREADHHCYYTYFELLELLNNAGFMIERLIPYRIPRNLDEWISKTKDPELGQKIRTIIFDSDIIKKELIIQNLETEDELTMLKRYGIERPQPGWRYWYNVAEIIAKKEAS